MSERTFRLRVSLVKTLRKKCGKSWKSIARECHVHPGTIKRWMAGGEVLMDNIGLLAKALNTTADKIILPDGEEDSTDYVNAEINIEGTYGDRLMKSPDITSILENAQKAIGAKYRIMLMYVGEGSIKIGIRLHPDDAMKLVKSFIEGKLRKMKVISISFLSSPPEHIKRKKEYSDIVEEVMKIKSKQLPERSPLKPGVGRPTVDPTKISHYKKQS